MNYRFNARGLKVIYGRVYYTLEKLNSSIASGSLYHKLGYKTPVRVESQIPVVIRKARSDYKCGCGQDIYADNLYAKPTAKFSTDKFCIDCITSVPEA